MKIDFGVWDRMKETGLSSNHVILFSWIIDNAKWPRTLALFKGGIKKVQEVLNVSRPTARKTLADLVAKHWLLDMGGPNNNPKTYLIYPPNIGVYFDLERYCPRGKKLSIMTAVDVKKLYPGWASFLPRDRGIQNLYQNPTGSETEALASPPADSFLTTSSTDSIQLNMATAITELPEHTSDEDLDTEVQEMWGTGTNH